KIPWRDAPEDIRLERALRNDVRQAAVDSVEVISRNCTMQVRITAGHNRSGQNTHLVPTVMKIYPHHIKGAAHIGPVRWSDHALVSKGEGLAAREDIDPTCCGASYLSVALPEG